MLASPGVAVPPGVAAADGVADAASVSDVSDVSVPPMDLPHYHGVGLGGQDDPVATPGGPGDPGSTANGTSKEVSGV